MRAIGKTGTLIHPYGAVDSFAYQRAILRMLAHDDKVPSIWTYSFMAYCHNNERIHVEGGYIGHDVSR